MMEKEKIQTVVQGEASESDEDNDVKADAFYDSSETVQEPNRAKLGGTSGGVVVSGEASESDEEEVNTDEIHQLPPLKVDRADTSATDHLPEGEPVSPTAVQHTDTHRPKYNSLLHRKLRDRNIALRQHIADTINQTYVIAGKDLHNNTLQLQKTQVAIQDVSHHMRLTTNDLFHLEDRVDIVASCNILPDININIPVS